MKLERFRFLKSAYLTLKSFCVTPFLKFTIKVQALFSILLCRHITPIISYLFTIYFGEISGKGEPAQFVKREEPFIYEI